MRIISGKYKGQTLLSFSAGHIRPTTDRVKESLFNILQSHIPDSRVVDLFAGTGNLGIEALSRGAASVTFVESHAQSLSLIRKNLEKLKVTETHDIIAKDVLLYLRSTKRPEKWELTKSKSTETQTTNESSSFDVIFADPPFTKEMADDVLKALSESHLFGPHTIMAIESAKREKLDSQYGPLIRTDHRAFGDKILSFFTWDPNY